MNIPALAFCSNDQCSDYQNEVPFPWPYCRQCGGIVRGDRLLNGEYHLLELIQSGRSSRTTYEAVRASPAGDSTPPLRLLVKRFEIGRSTSDQRAWENESKVLRSLSSEGIHGIPSFHRDFVLGKEGDYDRSAFIVIQYISGRTLKNWIDALERPPAQQAVVEAIRIFIRVLKVIGELHAYRVPVVHRDIKPENILISNSDIWLVDFGSAQLGEEEGAEFGTPEYMPREQKPGERCRPTVDIYATAMSLYHALVGNEGFEKYLGWVKDEKRQGMGLYEDDIPVSLPQPLRQVLLRATAQERKERYSSAGEFARDLEMCLEPTSFPGPARPAQEILAYARSPVISMSEVIPFEIGNIWGFERGSFLGILRTIQDCPIMEKLWSTERNLRFLTEERTPFPYRTWMQVQLGDFPEGPNTEAELLRFAKSPAWEGEGIPHSISTRSLPGVVIKARDVERGHLSSRVLNWCRKLLQIYAQRALAIVIEIDAGVELETPLSEHLREHLPGIVLVDDLFQYMPVSVNISYLAANQFAQPPKGLPLISWLEEARLRKKPGLTFRTIQDRYPVVFRVYERLKGLKPATGEFDASQLVADIDDIIHEKGDDGSEGMSSPREVGVIPVPGQEQPVDSYEPAVFISYAWGGESERIVEELEQAFADRGIQIIRDKKDLDYRGSIVSFEKRIARGQCIVLIISDRYLRSEHCMYELVDAEDHRELRERIFPIVLRDAKIEKPVDRLSYVQFWDEKIDELNRAIKQVDVLTNITHITAHLEKYARFRASMDHLINILNDMHALTPEIHAAEGFSTLINAVEACLAQKHPTLRSGSSTAQSAEISPREIDAGFDIQFLRLVEDVMPERIAGLVYAYAQSSRPPARRDSLVFSGDLKAGNLSWFASNYSRSDQLAGAWVDGSLELIASGKVVEGEPGYPFSAWMLHPEKRHSFASLVFLAALRLGSREKASLVIAYMLKNEDAALDRRIREIAGYIQGQADERKQLRKAWLSSPSAEMFALLLRSQVPVEDVDQLIRTVRRSNILSPDLWWFLSSQEASNEFIHAISSLSVEKRAIFGLLREEEARNILLSGRHKISTLVDCRRMREFAGYPENDNPRRPV